MGVAGEVPRVAVVGWRDLWLFVVGPVKAVAVGFVGKAKCNVGDRQPGGIVELYVNENANESGQGCDCDWDD